MSLVVDDRASQTNTINVNREVGEKWREKARGVIEDIYTDYTISRVLATDGSGNMVFRVSWTVTHREGFAKGHKDNASLELAIKKATSAARSEMDFWAFIPKKIEPDPNYKAPSGHNTPTAPESSPFGVVFPIKNKK